MAEIYYKCRMCGELFNQQGGSDQSCLNALNDIVYDRERKDPLIGNLPPKITYHDCKPKKHSKLKGIADFAGITYGD